MREGNGNGKKPELELPTVSEALEEAQHPGVMPLRNGRREQFAHYRAAGMSLRESYLKAGYKCKPEHASSSAANVLKCQDVKDRIEYLRGVLTAAIHARRLKVVEELESVAFTNLTDFMEWDENLRTIKLKASEDIPEDIRPALKSIQITEKGMVKVVAHDKLDALRQLREVHGLGQREHGPTGVTVVIVAPDKAESAQRWAERYSGGRQINPPSTPSTPGTAEED